FQHRLRQGREDGELRSSRGRSIGRGQLRGHLGLRALVLSQYLPRPPHHFLRQSGKFSHFDPVAAVGGAGLHFSQKRDSSSGFFYRHMEVLHSRKLLRQLGQFEVVGGKKCLGTDTRVQILDGRPGDGQSVVGGGAASHFV